MSHDTDIKKQALVVVELPGLTTNTKKDKRKSTQMEDQETEAKARHKLFKWEWKLWVNNTKTN